ncbi:MAG: dihydrofolate reductase [Mucinivorans sp.]
MKTLLLTMATTALLSTSCGPQTSKEATDDADFAWQVDTFDDIKVLQYKVHDFDSLTSQQRVLVYYLSQAALSGRDIIWDQNFKYNLPIRKTLEAIYTNFSGDKTTEDWKNFETYLKKTWFSNGIHHHYSGDKFKPAFSLAYFQELINSTPQEKLPSEQILAVITPVMFDSTLFPKRVNQAVGADIVTTSAVNFYEGVTQKEVEDFYAALYDSTDLQPVSYGLNSKVVKKDGQVCEDVYKVGGLYSPAIERVISWLEKAAIVAENDHQRRTIEALISYYRSGDLRQFDVYNVLWVEDTASQVDFVNGFIENYQDPMGLKATWESVVNFKDFEATKRTELISANAQWFEDNSPVEPKYKKPVVKGVSAKVITAAIIGGESYPSTAIGINLPNADWIRRDHGSKSVTIANFTQAYSKSAAGSGFSEEFYLKEALANIDKYSAIASDLGVDLHECLGHGSGRLAPGTKGDELKNYGSPLEEARAELFALYYIADPKLAELGVSPSLDVAKAEYDTFMFNGMMGQLTRIKPGATVEQAHMRCRKLIAEWAYELGQQENVMERVKKDGKTYLKINDYDKLRKIIGEQLREIQRIKSEGDFVAGKALIEKYAVQVDPVLHKEILERYAGLKIAPYSGFVNPRYVAVVDDKGAVVDCKIEYPANFVEQQLEYSKNFSTL